MRSPGAIFIAAALACVWGLSLQAQQPARATGMSMAKMTMPMPAAQGGTPPYHATAPKGALPPTLNPRQFSDPRVQAAYAMAAQVEKVLYQQPCYCGCNTEVGHKSLLDCYTGDHASICETCLMEGVFAYRETKQGKTPGQIRAAIERGEWKTVNLNDLLTARKY
jgi:hypothetical protein